MKNFRKVLFFAAMVLTVFNATAQERQGQHRRQREFNPEEFATYQTYKLQQALLLDSLQYQAVFLINYADALTMQDSMEVRRKRFEEMRDKGKEIRHQQPNEEVRRARVELEKQRREIRNEQMKQILNTEQYEKYLKIQEESSKRMRNRMERPRGKYRGARMNME